MMAVSTYYFSTKDGQNPEAEIGLSLKYTYLYHLGSLACGSFILALIVFAQFVAYACEKAAA